METSKEISKQYENQAILIASISEQINSLREIVTVKLENQKKTLNEIKERTEKTNGHVAENLNKINTIDSWKNKIAGGLIISNIFIAPALLWLLFKHFEQ